jgi:hypothetical protein
MLHIHGARGERVMGLLEMVTKEHNKGCKHIGYFSRWKWFFQKELQERYTI